MLRKQRHPLFSPQQQAELTLSTARKAENPTACPVDNAVDSNWVQELGPGRSDQFSTPGGTGIESWDHLKLGEGPVNAISWSRDPVRKPLLTARPSDPRQQLQQKHNSTQKQHQKNK